MFYKDLISFIDEIIENNKIIRISGNSYSVIIEYFNIFDRKYYVIKLQRIKGSDNFILLENEKFEEKIEDNEKMDYYISNSVSDIIIDVFKYLYENYSLSKFVVVRNSISFRFFRKTKLNGIIKYLDGIKFIEGYDISVSFKDKFVEIVIY